MSAFAYRQSYPLRDGFAVEFSLDGPRLEAAWSPSIPKGKQAKKLLPLYRSARGRFIASLAVATLVVEI